jgi:predicted lipid-binding transport protein (Tim44 family)
VPEGFDADAFLDAAKRNFVVLQQAWDAADLARLGEMMTDDMLANVQAQLAERGDQPNRTDVVTLQATLLGVEDLGVHFLASVEFSGMIREEISAGASPFREIWNLTKSHDGGSGWLLAGVQALQ